jgi:ribA/ribD-fused uncharacterized protein
LEKAIRAFRGKYAFLSNMYEAPFEWDGRMYRNSEAAFQSAKTLTKKYRDDFSGADGKKAKRMGRTISLRRDWESVKDGIMEEVVRAKFSQNPELLRRLIDTGDMELVEGNSWHDTYWGVDQETGEGKNHLGIILMKVRSDLSTPEQQENIQRMRAEKEAARQREADALQQKKHGLQEDLNALPVYDFAGKEMMTKAFGRVKIRSQEGSRLFFEVNGAVKKFAFPDCILQGFLIPDDPQVMDTFKRRKALEEALSSLENTISERTEAESRSAEEQKPVRKKTVRRETRPREKLAANFVQYRVDPAAEQEWMEREPGKSLSDAAIFVPEGKTLSKEAVETIRQFRYYRNGKDGFVLLADRVAVHVKAGRMETMARKAVTEAGKVMGNMPDFTPYDMDDDTGAVHMTHANVYGYRPFPVSESFRDALAARQECLEACDRREIVAIVYCSAGDVIS